MPLAEPYTSMFPCFPLLPKNHMPSQKEKTITDIMNIKAIPNAW